MTEQAKDNENQGGVVTDASKPCKEHGVVFCPICRDKKE
jgi:hypothetical protein